MKRLVLGTGRFKNIQHSTVSGLSGKGKCGTGNAGHGGYVKKDFSVELEGAGIKKKLKPLKFKF